MCSFDTLRHRVCDGSVPDFLLLLVFALMFWSSGCRTDVMYTLANYSRVPSGVEAKQTSWTFVFTLNTGGCMRAVTVTRELQSQLKKSDLSIRVNPLYTEE